LALGKTLVEIRAMPYSEFRSWQLFYMLEPFGWHDNEYRTAAILAMLYNANRGKGKAKQVKEFTRDVEAAIYNELKDQSKVDTMTREQIVSAVKKDFGL